MIRESNARVVPVSAGKDGKLNVDHLESLLRLYTRNDGSNSCSKNADKEERNVPAWRRKNPIVIGSFSAASNITGLICDVNRITNVLHRYGALSIWDYATAAPCMKVNIGSKVTNLHLEPFVYTPSTIYHRTVCKLWQHFKMDNVVVETSSFVI